VARPVTTEAEALVLVSDSSCHCEASSWGRWTEVLGMVGFHQMAGQTGRPLEDLTTH